MRDDKEVVPYIEKTIIYYLFIILYYLKYIKHPYVPLHTSFIDLKCETELKGSIRNPGRAGYPHPADENTSNLTGDS